MAVPVTDRPISVLLADGAAVGRGVLGLGLDELEVGTSTHVVEAVDEPAECPVVVGALEIRPSARTVTLDGAPVELTSRELDLLLTMAKAPSKVFTDGELLRRVWHRSPEGESLETVREHLHAVRRKLAARDGGERFVVPAVGGAGHRLRA